MTLYVVPSAQVDASSQRTSSKSGSLNVFCSVRVSRHRGAWLEGDVWTGIVAGQTDMDRYLRRNTASDAGK
jgi:hypothetical protein